MTEKTEAQQPTPEQLLQEKQEFLDKLSFVMGSTHGSITAILQSHDSEMRGKLRHLWDKLNTEIGELFYSSHPSGSNKPTSPQ